MLDKYEIVIHIRITLGLTLKGLGLSKYVLTKNALHLIMKTSSTIKF